MIEDLKERQEARRKRKIETLADEGMDKSEATKLVKEEPAAGAKKSSQPAEWKANA